MTTEAQMPVFESALRLWDEENRLTKPATRPMRRALFSAWWFIENIGDDVPDRTDIYFKVREIVRFAQ